MRRIVVSSFHALKQTGWLHCFEVGHLIEDCTVMDGERISCYAETFDDREHFEIDPVTLLRHTERL